MSAYIVSDATIDALVTFAIGGTWKAWDGKPQDLGQMLVDENYLSVNYRYRGEEGPAHKYKFHPLTNARKTKAVVILKLCACYEYQACEHPEWEESKARKVIDRIRNKAINELPGYDDAPWGLYNEDRETGTVLLSTLCG